MGQEANRKSFNFKEWYGQHGDALNKRRRDRYQNDPEYKARVLANNQASRKERRKAVEGERKEERKARRLLAEARPWKMITVDVPAEGDDSESATAALFSIGALAKALGSSIQAIRLWERQKIIPSARVRNTKGDRFYTVEEIDLIRDILLKQGRISDAAVREKPALRSYEHWVQYPNKKRPVKRTMFLVGAMARAVKRNVVTLEQLETRGVLPETPFRASKVGRRLYTREMIDVVAEAFDEGGDEIRGEEAWGKFCDKVTAGWKKLGVFGAKLVESDSRRKNKPTVKPKTQVKAAGESTDNAPQVTEGGEEPKPPAEQPQSPAEVQPGVHHSPVPERGDGPSSGD